MALDSDRPYGIRSNKDEVVHMRFGPDHGIYIAIQTTADGRVISSVDYETGKLAPLGKVYEGTIASLGRATTCEIKVMHAVMSRRHIEIKPIGNVLVIKDLGSTNKSFIFQENKYFDIEKYIENHPLDKAAEGTMDSVQEAFGPTLTDFLKKYQTEKEKPS